ncbi:MAG: response regulator [Acidobacteriota bacterium]|nr:response regulator [Acidobacteriota bacterium]
MRNSVGRVLVVDDDPSVLATYRRVLRRAGYEAHYYDDPRRLLGEADRGVKADLLLLDYKMPAIDGLTLLAELRNLGCRARCILISAFLNEDVRERAAVLSVDVVLDKPVDVCTLRSKVAELLPPPAETRTDQVS